MKQKLAIFDLDGTLFDTNHVNYESYKEALEKFHIAMPIEYEVYCKNWNGRSYKDFLPEVIKNNNEIIEKVHDTKVELYEKKLDKARENKDLFAIIEGIKEKYYIVIVTTASKKNANQIVKYFHKEKYFDKIITKEEVTKVKPDIEGFVKAMKEFNIARENTIIFEDSIDGITASRKCGAKVFIVDRF